jgi:amidohydrolase
MYSKLKLTTAALFCATQIFAQDYSKQITEKANQLQQKIVEWRRHIHKYPELGNREFNTANYIVQQLQGLGLQIQTGVAKTGIVAVLKGAKPGPCIGLRADMDALPVRERANLSYASKDSAEYLGTRVPVMHACGHDAHVAMLIATAHVLAGMRDKINGSIKFIFQPAEEGAPANEEGGAKLMVAEGVMDNPKVDVIFGIHIGSGIPIDEIHYKPGAFMASADWFTIKVKGKQSHGSQPWAGNDPITISTQIIQGLQNIVSRQMDIVKAPVVITVGKFNGGVRENIIPEECQFSGTIRTLDSAMQKDIWLRIERTAKNIAAASGATAEVTFDNKTLVTFNTPALVQKMLPSLQKTAGVNKVKQIDWVTGAEDFSFYGLKAPAFFFNVGGRDPQNTNAVYPHHTPDFLINDSNLSIGTKAFCNIVFDYLAANK